MNRMRQFLSYMPMASGFAVLAAFATFGTSCREPSVACSAAPMVDTAGEAAEKARIERQWLAVQGKLDSSSSTAAGLESRRSAAGSLDSAIARYRDSIRTDGRTVVSRSGCLDWRATWEGGHVDRTALATVWLRALVADGVGVVEWSLPDTVPVEMRLRALFTRPGPDGGSLDSAVLAVSPDRVELAAPADAATK
jgi:hypothetical protein